MKVKHVTLSLAAALAISLISTDAHAGEARRTSNPATARTSTASCIDPRNAARQRLFGCASPWNQRIPSPAPVATGSSQMIQGLLDNLNQYGYAPFALVNGSTPSLDYPTSATPLATVQMNTQAGCGAGGFFRIPITPGWELESAYAPTEGHGVSFLPNGDVYDYYHLTAPGVNPYAYAG